MTLANERRDARERALGLLYEAETKGCTGTEVLAGLPVAADDFAAGLVRAVDEHHERIDGLLGAHAKGWTVARMPAIDRAALRMGTAELITRPDVPTAVVLNETVDLAKRFSTDDSGRFVNGLLAKIATEVRPRVIPLPDPPLRTGDLLLRPWRSDDAPALVAAWADPDIQRWTGVPERCDLAAAERWIAGDEVRRARDLSLDLVVERAGTLAGEVGLSSLDRAAGTADVGWWTAPAHRGHGVASGAAGCLVEWARRELDLVLVARCDPANPASVAVARRADAMVLL